MLKALVGSGIDTDGLVKAHVILNVLTFRIVSEIGFIVQDSIIRSGFGLAVEIMLRSQIPPLPVGLFIGDADFCLIFHCRVIISCTHQCFVPFLTQQYFSRLRHIYHSLLIHCRNRIGIVVGMYQSEDSACIRVILINESLPGLLHSVFINITDTGAGVHSVVIRAAVIGQPDTVNLHRGNSFFVNQHIRILKICRIQIKKTLSVCILHLHLNHRVDGTAVQLFLNLIIQGLFPVKAQ